MDALVFLLERERMCSKNYDKEQMCAKCDAYRKDSKCLVLMNRSLRSLDFRDFARAVEVVEEWSKKNPKKTRADDFFEKFPDAGKFEVLESQGFGVKAKKYVVPSGVCPYHLGYFVEDEMCRKPRNRLLMEVSNMFCIECWRRPVES